MVEYDLKHTRKILTYQAYYGIISNVPLYQVHVYKYNRYTCTYKYWYSSTYTCTYHGTYMCIRVPIGYTWTDAPDMQSVDSQI
jgi:hypothetical protein